MKIFGILVGAGLAITITIGLAVIIADQASRNNRSDQECTGHHANHAVIIQNNKVDPVRTTAARCDTLTIINLDNTTRLMAFGEHQNHQAYDGIGEKLLNKSQSLKVTLVQSGNFKFHDHIRQEVQGTFSVR